MSVEMTGVRPLHNGPGEPDGPNINGYDNTGFENDKGYSSMDTITDPENVMVKIAEEPEDGYEYNSYQKAVLELQHAVFGTYKRHKTVVWTAIAIVLFILYFVYFGFALNYRFGDEGSWRLLGFTIFGVLLAVVVKLSNAYEKELDGIWGSTSEMRDSRTVSRVGTCISWCLKIAVFVSVLVYVILDIAIDHPRNMISIAGLAIYICIFYITSVNPARVNWHTVFWGIALQYIFALLILRTQEGYDVFKWLGDRVTEFLEHVMAGVVFVFGDTWFQHFFAMKVLSIIVFFFTFINIMYYIGVMQAIIKVVGRFLAFCMGTTPAESINAAANIFVSMITSPLMIGSYVPAMSNSELHAVMTSGFATIAGGTLAVYITFGTESPLMIRPFLKDMTRSELHAVMTGGFSTIAGSVLGAYISFGVPANHLLSASVMSAPAALAISKLSYPETERTKASKDDFAKMEKAPEHNIVEAASNGATASIKIVGAVAVNVLAFLSLLAFLNATLTWFGDRVGQDGVTFEWICSYVLYPVAYFMGVDPSDCRKVAELIGVKTFTNEFIAYGQLKDLIQNRKDHGNYTDYFDTTDWYWEKDNIVLNITGQVLNGGFISEKSEIIATYALCGFANFGSIGITLGGLGALAPTRKSDLSRMVVRAMICGNVACFLTACIAGLLYKPF